MNEISYIRRGAGKDMVFFHGYGASKECFIPQIEYFAKSFRVTAFDFGGFGASAPLPFPFSVGDYAAQTKAFLSSLGIQKPHVVAHSFGARVAVKLAGAGDVFDKMLLTGAAGIIDNRNAAYQIKVFSYRLARRFSRRYAQAHFGSREYRSLSPLMRESYKKIVNEDLRLTAGHIRSEVLLVQGADDKTTTLRQADIYRRAIPRSSLVVLKNCGHFAFLDDPVTFNLIAEEFFN